MSSLRALVVGGNGFIGAALVDSLAQMGWSLDVFDRFSAPPRYAATNVRETRGIVSIGDQLRSVVDGQDLVVHCISATDPSKLIGGPQAEVMANLLPALDLLSECVRTGVRRVAFVSSGGTVYGDSAHPAKETDPLLPISPYGIGKVAVEHYLEYYRVEHGLESVVLRVANPYGLRSDGSLPAFGIVSALLRAVRSGGEANQIGDGTMVRDYIHIADAVEMISRVVVDEGLSGPVNIGSGVGTQVRDVIETVRRVTGAELPVRVRDAPASFVKGIVLDVSRHRERYGSTDARTLDVGIADTWQRWGQTSHA